MKICTSFGSWWGNFNVFTPFFHPFAVVALLLCRSQHQAQINRLFEKRPRCRIWIFVFYGNFLHSRITQITSKNCEFTICFAQKNHPTERSYRTLKVVFWGKKCEQLAYLHYFARISLSAHCLKTSLNDRIELM